MTGPDKPALPDINERILQGIDDGIEQRLSQIAAGPLAHEVRLRIRQDQVAIEAKHASWVEDDPSRFHLRLMARLLAGYRSMRELLDQEECLALLRSALIEPSRQPVRESVRRLLDDAVDPMAALVDISRVREETFFGRTFAFARHQDDSRAYLLHVVRCFYHQFAIANGVPELMDVLCEWDWIWAEAIDPVTHGFSFELPTTLGYGGDVCRFCFRRLSGRDGGTLDHGR